MKFNLTITEMTDEEFAQIAKAFNFNSHEEVSKIDTTDIVLTNEPIVPVEGDFEEPAPYEPAYDKNGLPWDARIHSSNHKLTDKGVWQRRRGITDMEFERVRNELLGVQAPVIPTAPVAQVVSEPTAPIAPVAQVQPQVIAPTPLVTPEIYAPQVTQPTAPIAPVAPTTPVAPVAPTAQPDATILFKTMFEKVKGGMAAGVVKANDVRDLITAVNTQFGTQYQTLAAINDNVAALQFVINDLVSKGL